jgi:ribosomal protein L9
MTAAGPPRTSPTRSRQPAPSRRDDDLVEMRVVHHDRRRIGLDEPIKSLGEFTVPVRLHGDVTAQLKVSVSRE